VVFVFCAIGVLCGSTEKATIIEKKCSLYVRNARMNLDRRKVITVVL